MVLISIGSVNGCKLMLFEKPVLFIVLLISFKVVLVRSKPLNYSRTNKKCIHQGYANSSTHLQYPFT